MKLINFKILNKMFTFIGFSISVEDFVEVCKSHFPDFQSDFDNFYVEWKKENKCEDTTFAYSDFFTDKFYISLAKKFGNGIQISDWKDYKNLFIGYPLLTCTSNQQTSIKFTEVVNFSNKVENLIKELGITKDVELGHE